MSSRVGDRRAWLGAMAAMVGATCLPRATRASEGSLRLIVPYPAGGASDRVARALAGPLSEAMGRPVQVQYLVDDAALRTAMTSASDGSVLIVGSVGSIVLGPLTGAGFAIDPAADLAPVSLLGTAAQILTVHPSLPARRLDELVAHLRSRPDTFAMGSPGTGTVPHLAGQLFARRTGVRLREAIYASSAAVLEAHVRGDVEIAFESQVIERVNSGQLRAIAVMSNARVAALKDVPAISEAGVPGIDTANWLALFAARATPERVLRDLAAGVQRAVAQPGFAALAAEGFEVRAGPPEQLGRFVEAESGRWARYLREVGITPVSRPRLDGR